MMRYTDFEAQLLVATYLANATSGDGISRSGDLLDRYALEFRDGWVAQAAIELGRQGFIHGRGTMGGDREQPLLLTPAGMKEAERLIHLGLKVAEKAIVVLTEVKPSNDDTEATVEIPASDRIVRLDHNSVEHREVVLQCNSLLDALSKGNDVGSLSAEDVSVAIAETKSLQIEIQGDFVRRSAFWERSHSLLAWVAKEAAGAIVGVIALAAIAAFAALLGYPVPF